MADAMVRAEMIRFTDYHDPGWIEVCLVDADGHTHQIVEKEPILTDRNMREETPYPTELWLRAEATEVHHDRVQVTFAYGVETTDGRTAIQVSTADVKLL